MLIIKTTGIEDYLDGGEGRVKALIQGQPGSGKTRSASFWPKPLLLDCEDGRMSVADRGIDYARIESSEDMKAVLKLAWMETQKPVEERRWMTLIIDTLDSYQRIVIQERLKVTGNEGLSGWADWGYLDGKMQTLVSALQALRMNVVVNLHVKETKVGEDEEGKGGYLVQGPKLKGDLREQIGAEFDLVGHMGTTFESNGDERVQVRGVQWHATPDRPGLKDRSGTLPKWTPVTFTDDDYYGLFSRLIEKAESLQESRVVEEVETAELPQPVGPMAGGPVAAKKTAAAPPAKKTAAAQVPTPVDTPPAAAAVPAAPAARAVPAAARPVIGGASSAPAAAPVQAPAVVAEPVAEPQPEPEPTVEEAVALVEETLGGTVISEPTPADGPTVTPAEAPAAPAPVAPAAESTDFPACGQGRDADVENPVPGCGKVLRIGKGPDGSLVIDDPDENPDLIEIAGLKTRTWLCNSDFATYRANAKKG